MSTQVITIQPFGVMSGLQRKPGQGLDLRQFGKADIKRASLIEWNADQQAWFIDVLQEAGRGPVTFVKWANAVAKGGIATARVLLDQITKNWKAPGGEPLFFAEYDEAVKVEIAFLDALRLAGKF